MSGETKRIIHLQNNCNPKTNKAIAKHIEYFREHINYLLMKLANSALALIVVIIF